MPIYEYQCEQCGVRFERLQHMSADPISSCPECGGSVHRVISPVGVIFKGSGFYVTDNRSSSTGTNRGKSADDKTTSESPSETKASESKPDSSSEKSAKSD
jgi:putative FmdB family regulatory protein